MENNEDTFQSSPFDAIRRADKNGNEFWLARDLYKMLGYSSWQKFQPAIAEAKKACERSQQVVSDHFNHQVNMIKAGKGATRTKEDIRLSRYACYLIVLSGDSNKPIVALGKTYFAVQTRRQELADELALAQLSEDQKRLIYRQEMAVLNQRLTVAAQSAGVVKPEHFAIFTDHGYMGLYGGLRENDIHTHKNLQPQEKILDFMGSDELVANAFRASLTRQNLERDQVKDREKANKVHYDMGKRVRQTIIDAGATLPENLHTPEKSIQQLQREEQKRLEQSKQPSLFDQLETDS